MHVITDKKEITGNNEIINLWMEDNFNLTEWNAKFRLAINNLKHENIDYVTKTSLKYNMHKTHTYKESQDNQGYYG